MSVLEIKNRLHQIIANTDDPELLSLLFKIVGDQNTEDFWKNVSIDEKKAFDEGLAQLDQGLGIPHEKMVEKYQKWLSQ